MNLRPYGPISVMSYAALVTLKRRVVDELRQIRELEMRQEPRDRIDALLKELAPDTRRLERHVEAARRVA